MKIYEVLAEVASLVELEGLRGALDAGLVGGGGYCGTVGGGVVPMSSAGTTIGGRQLVEVASGSGRAVGGVVATSGVMGAARWEAWSVTDPATGVVTILVVRYVGFGVRLGEGSYVVGTPA